MGQLGYRRARLMEYSVAEHLRRKMQENNLGTELGLGALSMATGLWPAYAAWKQGMGLLNAVGSVQDLSGAMSGDPYAVEKAQYGRAPTVDYSQTMQDLSSLEELPGTSAPVLSISGSGLRKDPTSPTVSVDYGSNPRYPKAGPNFVSPFSLLNDEESRRRNNLMNMIGQ